MWQHSGLRKLSAGGGGGNKFLMRQVFKLYKPKEKLKYMSIKALMPQYIVALWQRNQYLHVSLSGFIDKRSSRHRSCFWVGRPRHAGSERSPTRSEVCIKHSPSRRPYYRIRSFKNVVRKPRQKCHIQVIWSRRGYQGWSRRWNSSWKVYARS